MRRLLEAWEFPTLGRYGEQLDHTARILRDQGKVGGGDYHGTVEYNRRMTELQTIIGLTQLRRLDEFIGRRKEIAAIYGRSLACLPGIDLPDMPEGVGPHYYEYFALKAGARLTVCSLAAASARISSAQ